MVIKYDYKTSNVTYGKRPTFFIYLKKYFFDMENDNNILQNN